MKMTAAMGGESSHWIEQSAGGKPGTERTLGRTQFSNPDRLPGINTIEASW